MSKVFLDVKDKIVGGMYVDPLEIIQIIPSADGCLVYLRSHGILKLRQTASELANEMIDAINDKIQHGGDDNGH